MVVGQSIAQYKKNGDTILYKISRYTNSTNKGRGDPFGLELKDVFWYFNIVICEKKLYLRVVDRNKYFK